jgi:hypothetical protein
LTVLVYKKRQTEGEEETKWGREVLYLQQIEMLVLDGVLHKL